jgi:RNA polymerase sigma-70 factor (ECF subfamily)
LQDEKAFILELLNAKTQNEAFRKLLQLYQKPLYFHIRNMVLNHDDADDVLQNTIIKVFANLKNFKGDSKLYSWMYRIATNEAITFMQQRAKKQGISNEEAQQKAISQLGQSGSKMQEQSQQAEQNRMAQQQAMMRRGQAVDTTTALLSLLQDRQQSRQPRISLI